MLWSLLAFILLLRKVEGGYVAHARSHFNNHIAALAVDGDMNTCYKSGQGFKEWLVVDMGRRRQLKAVVLKGSLESSNVRVGDWFGQVASREEFQENSLCLLLDNSDGKYAKMEEHTITCDSPKWGRYVSFQLVDPSTSTQLVVCDVTVVDA